MNSIVSYLDACDAYLAVDQPAKLKPPVFADSLLRKSNDISSSIDLSHVIACIRRQRKSSAERAELICS